VKTSVRELAELVLDITGAGLEVEYRTAGQTFVTNRVGSTDKAKREIGFEANVGLREGLEKLIAWRSAHKRDVARNRSAAEGQ